MTPIFDTSHARAWARAIVVAMGLSAGEAASQNDDLSIDLTSNANTISAGDAATLILRPQLRELTRLLRTAEAEQRQAAAQGLSTAAADQSKAELTNRLIELLYKTPGETIRYLQLGVPGGYNTNPSSANRNTTPSSEFDPKVQLHEYITGGVLDKAAISWTGTFDLDRFPSASAANVNNAQSLMHALLTDPKGDVVPYVAWQLAYKSQLANNTTNTNNDGGGGIRAWVLRLATGPDPAASARLFAEVTRRFTSTGTDSTSIYAQSAFVYDDKDSVVAKLTPSIRVRWFDESAGTNRRDTTLIVPVQVGWYPGDLLKNIAGTCVGGALLFNAQGMRNWSTVASKDAMQWQFNIVLQVTFWEPSNTAPC